MEQKVLILGARGRFGLAAAKAFAAAGWQVIAHMREGAQVPPEVQGDKRMTWLSGDVFNADEIAQQSSGASVVLHAMNPAYTQRAWQQEVLPMADAAIRVSRLLGATLMVPGNVYNFGASMPGVLREDTPQAAHTVKGKIRVALEQRLVDSGIPCVVIRAGDFFGGGKGTWFDQAIVKDIKKGIFSYPGQQDTPTAWAYLPDLARTFVAVAGRRTQLSRFEVLHFAGHQVSGRRWLEVLQPLALQQGWIPEAGHLAFKGMPWGIIRALGRVIPTWGALAEMKYLWDTPYALDNRKLTALIGPEPHTHLPEAAAAALADLGLITASTVVD